MRTDNRKTVVGVFRDHAQAQQAIAELRRLGFQENQIAVLARDHDRAETAAPASDAGTKAGVGAATGVAAGAGLGALYALGIASIGLPALGPVVILGGGLLASVLSSAAIGAAAAGIAGALIGLGIPEDEAAYYEGEVKGGRVLVTIQAGDRYDEADAVLRRFGAYNVHSQRSATPTMPAAAQPTAHATAADRPSAASEGVPEHRTMDVAVEREEIVIEREPASDIPGKGEPGMGRGRTPPRPRM